MQAEHGTERPEHHQARSRSLLEREPTPEELAEENIKLAAALAVRYGRWSGDDAYGEALLGLVEAAHEYIERKQRGVPYEFSGYAGWVIRRRLHRMAEKRTCDQHRNTNLEEAETSEHADPEREELRVEKIVEENLERQAVREAMHALSEREEYVVWAIWWEETPQVTVARTWGVTKNRVGQVHARALQKLEKRLQSQGWQ